MEDLKCVEAAPILPRTQIGVTSGHRDDLRPKHGRAAHRAWPPGLRDVKNVQPALSTQTQPSPATAFGGNVHVIARDRQIARILDLHRGYLCGPGGIRHVDYQQCAWRWAAGPQQTISVTTSNRDAMKAGNVQKANGFGPCRIRDIDHLQPASRYQKKLTMESYRLRIPNADPRESARLDGLRQIEGVQPAPRPICQPLVS